MGCGLRADITAGCGLRAVGWLSQQAVGWELTVPGHHCRETLALRKRRCHQWELARQKPVTAEFLSNPSNTITKLNINIMGTIYITHTHTHRSCANRYTLQYVYEFQSCKLHGSMFGLGRQDLLRLLLLLVTDALNLVVTTAQCTTCTHTHTHTTHTQACTRRAPFKQ